VGAVKTQSRIIRGELNPEWNQVFAVGRDKIHGGTLELTVWDAVPNPSTLHLLPLWKFRNMYNKASSIQILIP
jgi:hypothetical protein